MLHDARFFGACRRRALVGGDGFDAENFGAAHFHAARPVQCAASPSDRHSAWNPGECASTTRPASISSLTSVSLIDNAVGICSNWRRATGSGARNSASAAKDPIRQARRLAAHLHPGHRNERWSPVAVLPTAPARSIVSESVRFAVSGHFAGVAIAELVIAAGGLAATVAFTV